jgi:hypothetical protein
MDYLTAQDLFGGADIRVLGLSVPHNLHIFLTKTTLNLRQRYLVVSVRMTDQFSGSGCVLITCDLS